MHPTGPARELNPSARPWATAEEADALTPPGPTTDPSPRALTGIRQEGHPRAGPLRVTDHWVLRSPPGQRH